MAADRSCVGHEQPHFLPSKPSWNPAFGAMPNRTHQSRRSPRICIALQVIASREKMAKLAFDTGGTFTDFALLDDKGELHLHKVLSTPSNPAEAVAQGVSELLAQFGDIVELDRLQVLGATTVVTNAVLERKGVKTGFITTAGLQDMLRIRNEGRYDLYDLNLKYPDPLVTRANSFGAVERVTADGEVIAALEEDIV